MREVQRETNHLNLRCERRIRASREQREREAAVAGRDEPWNVNVEKPRLSMKTFLRRESQRRAALEPVEHPELRLGRDHLSPGRWWRFGTFRHVFNHEGSKKSLYQ